MYVGTGRAPCRYYDGSQSDIFGNFKGVHACSTQVIACRCTCIQTSTQVCAEVTQVRLCG